MKDHFDESIDSLYYGPNSKTSSATEFVGLFATSKAHPMNDYMPEVPRFIVPNKRVAVEPFPVTDKKSEVVGGVLRPMNAAALTRLKVVFHSEMAPAGSFVYVRSKLASTTTYGKEKFEIEGKEFILLPLEEILVTEEAEEPKDDQP